MNVLKIIKDQNTDKILKASWNGQEFELISYNVHDKDVLDVDGYALVSYKETTSMDSLIEPGTSFIDSPEDNKHTTFENKKRRFHFEVYGDFVIYEEYVQSDDWADNICRFPFH